MITLFHGDTTAVETVVFTATAETEITQATVSSADPASAALSANIEGLAVLQSAVVGSLESGDVLVPLIGQVLAIGEELSVWSDRAVTIRITGIERS